jgi:hypothetical protein
MGWRTRTALSLHQRLVRVLAKVEALVGPSKVEPLGRTRVDYVDGMRTKMIGAKRGQQLVAFGARAA